MILQKRRTNNVGHVRSFDGTETSFVTIYFLSSWVSVESGMCQTGIKEIRARVFSWHSKIAKFFSKKVDHSTTS